MLCMDDFQTSPEQTSSEPMNRDAEGCSVCERLIGSSEGRYNLPDGICCVAFHGKTDMLPPSIIARVWAWKPAAFVN
jgi:hypothetical protein